MTESEAARMIEGIAEWDRAIVIYPAGKKSGVRFLGMSREQTAEMLYQVADAMVAELPAKTRLQ